jgi:hypothetical protein
MADFDLKFNATILFATSALNKQKPSNAAWALFAVLCFIAISIAGSAGRMILQLVRRLSSFIAVTRRHSIVKDCFYRFVKQNAYTARDFLIIHIGKGNRVMLNFCMLQHEFSSLSHSSNK